MKHPHESRWFHEHCEDKINRVMDGQWSEFPYGLIQLPPPELGERDHETRARYQRTFIWGGIDEKAFIRHIGSDPRDFAMRRERLELGGAQMNELRERRNDE